jgi:hypothetical protein
VWRYDDRTGGNPGLVEVNVLSTQLDLKASDYYRVRVYGRDFAKNTTDLVRLYFDTDEDGGVPEFRMSWYLGRNPARPLGHTAFKSVTDWENPKDPPQHVCPGIRHQANYAKDVITVLIPRRCLGHPDRLRWAGFVMSVRRIQDGSIFGPADHFPRGRTFPAFWVDLPGADRELVTASPEDPSPTRTAVGGFVAD